MNCIICISFLFNILCFELAASNLANMLDLQCIEHVQNMINALQKSDVRSAWQHRAFNFANVYLLPCVSDAHSFSHLTHTYTHTLLGKDGAADLGERLHMGLVRLLMGEAYDATSTYLMSITSLPLNK